MKTNHRRKNPVARADRRVNRAAVHRDRTQYNRKEKNSQDWLTD